MRIFLFHWKSSVMYSSKCITSSLIALSGPKQEMWTNIWAIITNYWSEFFYLTISGPLIVDRNSSGTLPKLVLNPYAWTQVMMFLVKLLHSYSIILWTDFIFYFHWCLYSYFLSLSLWYNHDMMLLFYDSNANYSVLWQSLISQLFQQFSSVCKDSLC